MNKPLDMLPCPFCGEIPDLAAVYMDEATKWGAIQCCCVGPEVRTGYQSQDAWENDAIAAWNQRTPAAPVSVPSVPYNVKSAIGDVWGFVNADASFDDLDKAASLLMDWLHVETQRATAEGGK